MEHLPAKKSSYPDEYIKSSVWISLTSEDGKYHIGNMQRCGVTPPGYPDRATYYKYNEKREIDEVFVYDGGYFWNAAEWRAFFRQHGITPAQMQSNTACSGLAETCAVCGSPVVRGKCTLIQCASHANR